MSANLRDNPTFADRDLLTRLGIALVFRDGASFQGIRLEVHQGVVTLTGEVSSAYLRNLAYDTVRHVAGVRAVRDRLNVALPDEYTPEPIVQPAIPLAWRHVVALPLVLLAIFAASGCSQAEVANLPVHPVEGQVTLKGKPLADAFVVLHPRTGETTPKALGKTDAQGQFKVSTYRASDGAVAGDYVVTVQRYPLVRSGPSVVPGPNDLPQKLANPQSSTIQVHVANGANKLQTIEVAS